MRDVFPEGWIVKEIQPKLRASTFGRALGIGLWIAASGAMAQEQASGASQEQAGKPAESAPVAAANQTPSAVRTMATGSNIIRVRSDHSLPLLVLDRAYIEQSGTTTPNELIQSLPQAQNLRTR
jgi:hypothetical protein